MVPIVSGVREEVALVDRPVEVICSGASPFSVVPIIIDVVEGSGRPLFV